MIKNYIEKFLFFPNKELKKTPSILNIDYEDVFIEHNENNYNNTYHGWFMKNNSTNTITKNKCILFFHGNAGNISFRMYYIEKLYEAGFSLLFFDYPGFGLSTGSPNEEICVECAEKFYQYLLNKKKYINSDIIFYGESIGGAIAASTSEKNKIKYLILQSTFTNIKEIITYLTHINSIFLKKIGFETLEKLKIRYKINNLSKKMKTMVIHSNEDEIIDNSHAVELSKYSDKYYIATGTHSNLTIDSNFIFNLLSFIKE
jgi:esterase/lipase